MCRFFGSGFCHLNFSYSSLSIKVLISFLILYTICWKSKTKKWILFTVEGVSPKLHVLSWVCCTCWKDHFFFSSLQPRMLLIVENQRSLMCRCGKERLLNGCMPSFKNLNTWWFSETCVLRMCIEEFSTGICHALIILS